MQNKLSLFVFLAACGGASVGSSSADVTQDAAQSDAADLNEQLFCRNVQSRKHCVSFSAAEMHDNAPTFFGNPPKTAAFKLVDGAVIVNGATAYTFANRALTNDAGAVLRSVAFFDGYSYCRKVGEREHCLTFEDGQMSDNANTFFGNPPETKAYQLIDTDILDAAGGIVYTYSPNDDTIANDAGAIFFRQ